MKYFGTDGIRGIAGKELDYTLATDVAKALCSVHKNPKIIIGRDTRPSGNMLSLAFCLGAITGGGNIVNVGVCTTPAISYLTQSLEYDYGVVISASHNPSEYNGIKIFNNLGTKISEELEQKIEETIENKTFNNSEILGKYKYNPKLISKYTSFLTHNFKEIKNYSKIKIAVDCSNGASSLIAQNVFKKLGIRANFTATSGGVNINNCCGATCPQNLAKFTKKTKSDIGFAYDGDADRIVIADGKGNIYNGDNILYGLANFYKQNNMLDGGVVGTVMSNLGLELALKNENIKIYRADVGDKYVSKLMQEKGCNLGGEQSGHIILNNLLPTGDGLLTSLQILKVIKQTNKPVQELLNFDVLPQELVNVEVSNKLEIINNPEFLEFIKDLSDGVEGEGRILVRPSGTENKIRIMVEHSTKTQAVKLANIIKEEIVKRNNTCAE